MLKKLSYGIMIGLLACSVVAGCGGSKDKDSSSGGSTTATTLSLIHI